MQFMNHLMDLKGNFQYIFEVVNYQPNENLKINDPLLLVHEPTESDPNAVKIVMKDNPDHLIGYINYIQTEHVAKWLKNGKN